MDCLGFSGQVKDLLGVYTLPENMNHSEFKPHAGIVDDYYEIFDNIETVRWQDALLGIACSIILLTMRVSKLIDTHSNKLSLINNFLSVYGEIKILQGNKWTNKI